MRSRRNFSAKREAIYNMLLSSHSHPAAEWIYEQLRPEIPDLSLGTVYRNLAVLREAGMVRSIGVIGGQERFDANMTYHAHFICRRCFSVSDLPGGRSLPDKRLYETVEQECGAKVEGHSLTFYGICKGCLEENKDEVSISE